MYPHDIPVEQALDILRQQAPTPTCESVPLTDALGRVLFQDVVSLVDHPRFDNSALDGYACREEDTLTASPEHPVGLRIIGDVPAGSLFSGEVGTGQAVSIYTGAPLPKGASAIIAIEQTIREGDTVWLLQGARHKDIRRTGQLLRAGEVYLKRGRPLTVQALGLAATMGHGDLMVSRQPKVGILVTGNEVCEPGETLDDGQVYNSNAYAVAALVRQAGGIPVVLPKVRDSLTELKVRLEAHCDLDLLITTGGVSVGKYDLVRDLLLGEGHVHFWKVLIRPGSPVLFGTWEKQKILGLPGNPVACMVTFWILGVAWLHKILGRTDLFPYQQRLRAKALTPFSHGKARTAFWRAYYRFDNVTGHFRVADATQQDSLDTPHALEGLVVTQPWQAHEAGAWVDVIPFG
jgi:molybdopterin molybdotransferase